MNLWLKIKLFFGWRPKPFFIGDSYIVPLDKEYESLFQRDDKKEVYVSGVDYENGILTLSDKPPKNC